jgi:DNA primase
MGVRGSAVGKVPSTSYTEDEIKAILREIGVEIRGETATDFTCLCPFHYNRSTPALAVHKTTGQWYCFNPSCNKTGDIIDMYCKVTGKDKFQALRKIYSITADTKADVVGAINKVLSDQPDAFKPFPRNVIDQLSFDFWHNDRGIDYMRSRHFNEETLLHFDVGYSVKNDMVTVPLHSPEGMLVGLVGRSIEGKSFKNSVGLPTSKTMFNLHRARVLSSTVIVTESAFDTMRVYQAGYGNVIGNLGGHMSDRKAKLLDRMFDSIVIMTDADGPGRDLGNDIANRLSHKNILWASYEYKMIYPDAAKDAGDMTDSQIRQCIENAVPNYHYALW